MLCTVADVQYWNNSWRKHKVVVVAYTASFFTCILITCACVGGMYDVFDKSFSPHLIHKGLKIKIFFATSL